YHCPFHDDKNPSLKVNQKGSIWLWHCFGCGAGGNILTFVMKYEKISMTDAYRRVINGKQNSENRIQKTDDREQITEDGRQILPNPKAQRLLNKVVEYYHSCFYTDKAGMDYLINARKITDKHIFETFKIGYVNRTLPNTIPSTGEIPELLKQVGILNPWGKEHFSGCVVFPIFDEQDNCVEIYGRKIRSQNSESRRQITDDRSQKIEGRNQTTEPPKHLYLKGGHQGVFNSHAAKNNQTIILTEGIIDALSIYQAGFKNVIALYGTNGLTKDHLYLFQSNNVKQIHLCLDTDEAGKTASAKLKGILAGMNIRADIIELNDAKDANEYFSTHNSDDFARLLEGAAPCKDINTREFNLDNAKEAEEKVKILAEDSLILEYGRRKYLIRGIEHSRQQKLKVNIKAITEKGIHIDSLDLYTARQRKAFISEAAILFKEEKEVISGDINRMIERIKNYLSGKQTEINHSYIMADQEREEAIRFLKNPGLIEEILTDFQKIGCIGEENNKLIGYLVALSRKLDDPLSLLILSRSAAGKSMLEDSIVELVPEEERLKYTRITGQALFYKGENSLDHKLIAIEEEEGANQAAYSLRTIQSAKMLTTASTIKDPLTGDMKTREYNVKSRCAIILTTTRNDLDYETMNRFIITTIDESKEQTRLIHELQREKETLGGWIKEAEKAAIIKKHHNAQRLLKRLKVINPYAKYLEFNPETLRTRREHKKYLSLIKTIALLLQKQRPLKQIEHLGKKIEYIEVKLEDIEVANKIANEILGRSLDELLPQPRRLLLLLNELVNERKKETSERILLSRREIRGYTKWSDNQVRDHLKQLIELEYIQAVSGRNGSRYLYELIYTGGGEGGGKFFMGLIDSSKLKTKIKTGNAG
ncbi:MAG: toprim domain-containing protein, partial [Candidatus Omnitrophota bacterium]